MAEKPVVQDPWLLDADGNPDPFAQNIQYGMSKADEIELLDDQLDAGDQTLLPDVIRTPAPEPTVEPPPVVETPPEPEGPETMELEDGTALTIEKEKGQWKGTVANPLGGNPQIYWGKTLKELIFNTLKAQANATAQIRKLSKQVKLGAVPSKPAVSQQQPIAAPKVLSADEIFEIKTKLGDNPDAALDEWFQKKTGRSLQTLVEQADKGAAAEANLQTSGVCQAFLSRNPEYYGDQNNQNFKALVDWVAKFKLGRSVNPNPVLGMYELHEQNTWTLENLEEAFEDLKDVLLQKPQAPKPPPPVKVEEPVPAPRPNERIVQTVVRPRAALGIRPDNVTPVAPPETPAAPSVEDLEKLSDEQIAQLYQGIRRQRVASSRRSN